MSLEGPPLSRHRDEPNTQKYSEAKPSPAGVSMPGVLASIYVRALDQELSPATKEVGTDEKEKLWPAISRRGLRCQSRPPVSTEKVNAELAEMVVFVDGRTEAAGILEFAGVLAQEHGSHLTAVFMQPDPAATSPEMFARGKGMLSVIEAHQARLEGIEADHRALFEDIVRRQGIRSEWRSLPYLSSEVGVHAYYADLVVIARPDPAGQTAGPPGLAESLVLSSGRPIVMFPPGNTVSRVNRIVVAWNSRREAIRAVADALPLLVKAEAVSGSGVDP